MSDLPNAEHQAPACGTCAGETYATEYGFVCDDCGLEFDLEDLTARFHDPDAKPCGEPCTNSWHGDHRIHPGVGYDCGTCKLPSGHAYPVHWTGCEAKVIDAPKQPDEPSAGRV